MTVVEQILLGLALAMDAFAVSICKGLSCQDSFQEGIKAGLWFGGAQAFMTFLGNIVGSSFAEKIDAYDHWLAFILLVFIGLSMIKEAYEKRQAGMACPTKKRGYFLLAIATSIDALAVGLSLSFLKVKILSPVLIIGLTSFILSFIGVNFGKKIGSRYESISEFIGGGILILLGTKILLESLL